MFKREQKKEPHCSLAAFAPIREYHNGGICRVNEVINIASAEPLELPTMTWALDLDPDIERGVSARERQGTHPALTYRSLALAIPLPPLTRLTC
jgi:hypothetical protein